MPRLEAQFCSLGTVELYPTEEPNGNAAVV